jgi:DNA polymerase/3'-5' exonuclease PolX
LREAAELLEQQQANPFRVNAYRRAAETLAGLDEDVAALLEQQGIEGLDTLPGFGTVLAPAIAQMVRTGRWAQLDRLRGAVAPEPRGPLAGRRVVRGREAECVKQPDPAAHLIEPE